MKYVAFLDILGFKEKMIKMSQEEAEYYISAFASTIYVCLKNYEQIDEIINGLVVSDSVVLHTNDVSGKALSALIELIDRICKLEFSENGILIRGGVSKGAFDKMPAIELGNLQKELMVGQAYIEAYKLEGSLKTIGINLSREVYEDLCELGSEKNILKERIGSEDFYLYRYLSIDFFLAENNLSKFTELGIEAGWLPHYYNTLYFAISNTTYNKQVDRLLSSVLIMVQKKADWRGLDRFVEYSFGNDVIRQFKNRFLRYLRTGINKQLELYETGLRDDR